MEQNVRVAVRCRPMSTKETARGCGDIIKIKDKTITIKPVDSQHEEKNFTFDFCYGNDSQQTQVYNDLGKPIVAQALDGFNGTIFAYGQTGSGKTFSMMGTDDVKGIIPMLNEDLFDRLGEKLRSMEQEAEDAHSGAKTKCMITVSFLEVYNEEIKDLLNPSDKKMKIHENPKQGIYVDGLAELIVRDSSDLMRLIYQGNAVRRVAATKMNDQSSRSHSVFTIKLEQKTSTELEGGVTKEQLIKAKLNLVDLAGSERASKTGATGATLKEGANINLSLMALGNVINMLSEGAGRKGQKKIIPYRDSKLTRLLQESLGGNSATIMIAAISPADYNYSETLSTLKYANRAKSIENAVTRNEDNNERMIKDLQKQIEELKKKLENPGAANVMADPEIEKKLKEMQAEQMSAWEEKEKLSRALEEERQANMNTVISEMMHDVKEQKVQHMKNIKRLTNEKALLSKNFKEYKEFNVQLKAGLDGSIQKYQQLQQQYDEAAMEVNSEEFKEGPNGPSEEEVLEQQQKQAAAEAMANEMIALLTKIEEDRQKYTEKRDALKRMRARLDTIDDEITEERAELVATAGLLSQNDKLREQIQQEEREKMKVEFEAEISKAKAKLDEERQTVRDKISGELEQAMEQLRSEIKMLKSLLKVEESKNTELTQRHQQLQEYADSLEQRLADSEVAQEEVQVLTERLVEEKRLLTAELDASRQQTVAKDAELQALREETAAALEANKREYIKLVEEAKFDMFRTLMDKFEEERAALEKTHVATQQLLSQAAKDVMFLTQKNQELQVALNHAVHYEPLIQPNNLKTGSGGGSGGKSR